MRTDLYNHAAPKKATNLSVNSDLLEQAKSSKINLSQTLEQALAEKLREHKKRQWLAENRDALDNYNQRIEADGVFSDDLRQF
jgi:antitoxin CcdA